MTLLEETYRKVDPEGVLNMAFNDTEFKGSSNGMSSKLKNGKSPLDA
jgi:hypothetical protein